MFDKLDDIEQMANGNGKLPFSAFFETLKKEGISVTPAHLIDAFKIIGEFSNDAESKSELCYYLSPIFAKGKNEQERFTKVFNDYFGEKPPVVVDPIHPNPPKSKYGLLIGVAIAALFVIIYFFWHAPPTPNISLVPQLSDKDEQVKNNKGLSRFQLSVGDTLNASLFIGTDMKTNAGSLTINEELQFDWGDNLLNRNDTAFTKVVSTTDSGTTINKQHIYTSPGLFTITAHLTAFDSTHKKIIDTSLSHQVKVCPFSNTLNIEKNITGDTLKPGEVLKLSERVDGEKPDSIIWKVNNSPVKVGATLDTFFNTEGQYGVEAIAIYDSINSPCTLSNSASFTVRNPNKLVASIAPAVNAKPIEPNYKVKPFWFYCSAAVALFFILAWVVIQYLWKRKKLYLEEKDPALKSLVDEFKGKEPPYDLPFKSKNYLPVSQPYLDETGWKMRKRIFDGAGYLHVDKTIKKSINSNGLFQPVYANRSNEREYIALIDESYNSFLQAKLFDYLVVSLKKQGVCITSFYYNTKIDTCYNAEYPQGLSLQKIYDRYNDNVLLIFGDAHQLLHWGYPAFNEAYSDIISRWQYKAVVTPASFVDWGYKEYSALWPNIPVFPADAPGLLLFVQYLFGDEADAITDLKENTKLFYSCASINFNTIEGIADYCNTAAWAVTNDGINTNNIFFQWVAALAVYPKLNWELIVSVGQAVLERNNKGHQLNFTNLLRLTRIKWVADGSIPHYTRLELLKKLRKENEIAAREAILQILKDSDKEINNTHFAFEEKRVQTIINEFILYSYNPEHEQWRKYKDSVKLFEKLWQSNNILDTTSAVYLDKAGNWETLVNNTNTVNTTNEVRNISLNQYFARSEKAMAAKKFTYLSRIAVGLLLLPLTVLLLLSITNGKPSSFTQVQPAKHTIKFKVAGNITDGVPNAMLVTIDTSTFQLITSDTISLQIDDKPKLVSIMRDGVTILDSTMPINKDAYNIIIDTPRIRPDTPNTIIQQISLTPKFAYTTNNVAVAVTAFSQNNRPLSNATVTITSPAGTQFAANNTNIVQGLTNAQGLFTANFVYPLLNRQSYYTLTVRSTLNKLSASNEVNVIYKPIVYLHYRDASKKQEVQNLADCINKAGVFNALLLLDTKGNYTGDEIRYFERTFAIDSIKLLQQCLQQNYPAQKFAESYTPINHPTATAEIWINNSLQLPPVTITISDDSIANSAAAFKKELETKGYTVADIQKGKHSFNTRIIYESESLAGEAAALTNLFKQYYPQVPVKDTLIPIGAQQRQPGIEIWMQKADSLPPRIYIEIADESQRTAAKNAQTVLQKYGFLVPAITAANTDIRKTMPDTTEVRYFSNAEYSEAQSIVDILRQTGVAVNGRAQKATPTGNERQRHYEIWFAKLANSIQDCMKATYPRIRFVLNDLAIPENMIANLDGVVKQLKINADCNIQVTGWRANTNEDNVQTPSLYANIVTNYLVKNGIAQNRITVTYSSSVSFAYNVDITPPTASPSPRAKK